MAVYLINGAEGGSNGTAVSHANSGAASGSAWDSVSLSNATLAYDGTHAAHGLLSYKCATGTGAASQLQWTTSLVTPGTITQLWFRIYLYFTAFPSVTTPVFRAFGASARNATLQVTATTGLLQFIDFGGTNGAGATPAIPLNAWWRVEGFVFGSATLGQVELQMFTSSMDGTSADYSHTSSANLNTSGGIAQALFGITGTTGAGPYWMDDLGASDTGYPGPASYGASLAAAGAVTAPVLQGAVASLTATGALSAPAAAGATAFLTGSGTVTAAALQDAAASLTGSGTVAATAALIQSAAADLAGAGAVTAAGTAQAPATLTGAGLVTAPVTLGAAASPAGAGTVTAAAVQGAGAGITGTGVLAAPGTTGASAVFTGTGAVSAPAAQPATVTATGTGTLSAPAATAATAALAGTGFWTAAPAVTAGALLAGTGAVAAATTIPGSAVLAGLGAVSAGTRVLVPDLGDATAADRAAATVAACDYEPA